MDAQEAAAAAAEAAWGNEDYFPLGLLNFLDRSWQQSWWWVNLWLMGTVLPAD